jgi:riboflavin kinase/FMN adenylyltransferase
LIVHTDIDHFDPIKKAFVTTGTFDGVHLGHRVILEKIIQQAKAEGGESVLLTFYPHPRMVLFPDDTNLKLLTTQPEKIKLLEEIGLDHLIIQKFTPDFSRMQAYDYVRDILVNKIGVHKLIIGYDHQFGRNREGSIDQLRELTPLFNFKIEEIPAQDIDTVKISSTKIRRALIDGDIQQADRYLGYPYSLSGEVIHGNQLGRTIGFKTANILVSNKNKLIPGDGVYAVKVCLQDKEHQGMMNIGRRPTVENPDAGITIEVHIFNFDEDLYNKVITVKFLKRVRDEKKFDSIDSLKEQLHLDKKEILHYLNQIDASNKN